MQDYSRLQYEILQRIFSCRMTILGDRAQPMDDKQQDVLKFLPKIFGRDIHKIIMNKSYRNTIEIASYANQLAGIEDMELFERHGAPVEEKIFADMSHAAEEIAEKLNMPAERVREIMRIAQDPVSLETPIGEEEDSHLGDFIPDDDAPAPADAASLMLLKEQLNDVLSTLTDREAKVLKLRFGLEDGRSRTLEEVGKEFDVTRERIRQIEAKALRKLRHPSRSKKVIDFLD